MLVLSRRRGEKLYRIADGQPLEIICVVGIGRNRVKLGLDGPRHIQDEELYLLNRNTIACERS